MNKDFHELNHTHRFSNNFTYYTHTALEEDLFLFWTLQNEGFF